MGLKTSVTIILSLIVSVVFSIRVSGKTSTLETNFLNNNADFGTASESLLLADVYLDTFEFAIPMQVRMAEDTNGALYLFWAVKKGGEDYGEYYFLESRICRDGKWGSAKTIKFTEPFHSFRLCPSPTGLKLATIFNKQDEFGRIQIFDIDPEILDISANEIGLSASKSIAIDFSLASNRIKTNNVTRFTNSYRITNVLLGTEEQMWILGHYVRIYRNYILFFLSGGEQFGYNTICAWEYKDNQLSNCRTLLGKDAFLWPSYIPICTLGEKGTPYVLVSVEKEGSGKLPYLFWYDGIQWQHKEVPWFAKGSKRPKTKGLNIEPKGLLAISGEVGLLWWKEPSLYFTKYGDGVFQDPIIISTSTEPDYIRNPVVVSDAHLNQYFFWSGRHGISYRAIINGKLTPIHFIDLDPIIGPNGVIRKLLVSSDQAGKSIHLTWVLQKDIDDRVGDFSECSIYYNRIQPLN